jgi:N-hydroxyarylamine O-acetyltransferase
MDDHAAVLARLGLDAGPPSLRRLVALHRAFVERVPYETTWIALGEGWDVDDEASLQRIAWEGRGGYCFHMNGAFARLLDRLGYEVTRHVGGVHGPEPDAAALTNHLVLTVAALPTEENPGGRWYVDVGLGDALYEPMPLMPGTVTQGPFTLRLEAVDDGVGDWRLHHDPRGGFRLMSFRDEATDLDAFAEMNRFLSTSPDSQFVKVLTAQRRLADRVEVLRGLVFETIGADGHTSRDLTERADWFGVLADHFGLRFTGVDPSALDELWRRWSDKHERWRGRQGSGTTQG